MEHQIDCLLRHVFDGFIGIDLLEPGKACLEFWDLSYPRPVFLGGSSPELEDLKNLVNFRVSDKQRSLFIKLVEDASYCPGVHPKRVLPLTKQNLWGSVP